MKYFILILALIFTSCYSANQIQDNKPIAVVYKKDSTFIGVGLLVRDATIHRYWKRAYKEKDISIVRAPSYIAYWNGKYALCTFGEQKKVKTPHCYSASLDLYIKNDTLFVKP